jgi:hypothetical protein
MHDQMTGLGAALCIAYTRQDVAQRTLALAGGRSMPSLIWPVERSPRLP